MKENSYHSCCLTLQIIEFRLPQCRPKYPFSEHYISPLAEPHTAPGKCEDIDVPERPPPRAIPSYTLWPADSPDCQLLRGSTMWGPTGPPFLPWDLPSGGQCLLRSSLGLAKSLPGLHLALTFAQSCFLLFPRHVLILNKHMAPHTPSQLLLQNSACRKGPWCPVTEGVSTPIHSIVTLLPQRFLLFTGPHGQTQ